MIANLPKKLDALVFNGDLIQAVRPPWGGLLIAPNCDDQAKCAVELLKPIVQRTKETYFNSGTNYHNIDVGDYEQQIAEALGAEYGDHWDLEVEGKVLNFAHGHMGGFVYRGGMIERETFFGALASEMGQVPKADCIVRSHIHFYIEYRSDNRVGYFTPGWQLPDAYQSTRAASYYKSMPCLGAFLLEITDEAMPDGIRSVRAPFAFAIPKYSQEVRRIR
jgi:hypothetical protein